MGMDRSDRRRVRTVATRDHDESLGDERWKGGYDDSKAKHRSKEKSRSSQRDDKNHRSRDRERSKISDVSKKRERESNDDSRNQRKKDINDREKDRTWDLKNKTNASELQDRVMRMKEERLKRKSDDSSDVVSWVSKSRKLEDKRNAEKEKALHFSKMFEEQDNVTRVEDEDEPPTKRHTSRDLAGFKVLDGHNKVVEGGAVVLTLKDQNILADGDINQEVDMLENVEIGEQKRRNEAYKAAKKNTGVYDKFIEEPGFEKKILPQYDDPFVNQGITLDEKGNISGEAEKTLEEYNLQLHRRRSDAFVTPHFEDLTSTRKDSTDYYTSDEMLTFKKPKKKKSLRKKEKFDIDALEAEARSAGLDSGDHGSRSDGKRQAQKEEHERSVTEKRNNAFQSAYMKADEASKALRMEPTVTVQKEQEEEEFIFGTDDDDLHNSLQRTRKLALQMKDGTPSGPHSIALLATSTSKIMDAENGDSRENQVVFTEMKEFVWGLQLDEEKRRRQHDEELKVKQMNNTDTPSQSSKRMREALFKNQTPYLVLN
ncbi:SART-1 protein [Artemisia annua]|uniref:SART-1 protein n=1 Tax=Artemisia annua TaxID=35608 RepID=A0A2U1MHJ1_ARTAN|nr:SART-1 protein [Artemisia annua]